MKEKFLALLLALALCLAPATALAAEAEAGDTAVVDANGVIYQLSKPIIRVEPMPEDVSAPVNIVYVVPAGTQIVPIAGPDGYRPGRDDENMFIVFKKTEADSITIWSEALYQGLGGADGSGLTLDMYDNDKYTKYRGFMSQRWLGDISTDAHTLFTCAAPEDEPAVPGFTDVNLDDWFYEPVQWAVAEKITAGTSATAFSPNAACTQGQILTFLWRAKGEPKPTGTVSGAQYYAAAAQWAKEQGLTDDFSAEADCTRAMVVTYLWKLAGSPKTGASNFSDVPAGADYAQAVAWAVEQGVTAGTSDAAFSPQSACTRAQIVTFLYRGLEK